MVAERHMTQEMVAAQSRINYSTLRGWMAKKRLPDVEDAVKLATVLGTNVEYLVTGRSQTIRSEEDELLLELARDNREVLERLARLSKEQKTWIKGQLDTVIKKPKR